MAEVARSPHCTATASSSSPPATPSKMSEQPPSRAKKSRPRGRRMDNRALLRKAIRTSYSIKKIKYREAAAKMIEDEQSECSDSDSGDDSDASEGSSSSTPSSPSSPLEAEATSKGLAMHRSNRSDHSLRDLDGSTKNLLQSVTHKLEEMLKSDTCEASSSPSTPPRPIKKAHSSFQGGSKSPSSPQKVFDPITVPMLHLQSASVSLKRQEATSYLLYRRRKILAAMKQSGSDEDACGESNSEEKKETDCLQEGYEKVELQLEELLKDDREETEEVENPEI